MSTNPASQQPLPATKSGNNKLKKAPVMTRGQLAVQAAATTNQESGEASTANGRKIRDTMAKKNGRVAETILRERALEEDFVGEGGVMTDGNNAQTRLKKLGIPVDAAGRSPSSLVAVAGSSPLSEQDRFSFSRGPPQTPTRTPSHLSTVPQHPDPPPNRSDHAPSHNRPAAAAATTASSNNSSAATLPTTPTGQGGIPGPSGAPLAHPGHPHNPVHAPSHNRSAAAAAATTSSSNNSSTATLPTTPMGQGGIPRPLGAPLAHPGHSSSNIPSASTLPTTATGRGGVPHLSAAPPAHPGRSDSTLGPIPVTVPPQPSSSTQPAPPLVPNPRALSSSQTANRDQDPWARTQGIEHLSNVPVRVELGKTKDHNNPLAPTTHQYVTVPSVDKHEGLYTCKLSDVLGRLAEMESPLRARTSKIYRLGPARELVALGRGNDLTNPSDTRLTNNSFLNTHRIERTEVNGIEIFTGIKIFYEHQPSDRSAQRPIDFFEEDEEEDGEAVPNPGRATGGRKRTKRSDSKHSTAGASTAASRSKRPRLQRSPSPSSAEEDDSEDPPFNPEHELYPCIRRMFKLDPTNLPGQWDVRTAREGLERYLAVDRGEKIATERMRWRIPNTEHLTVVEGDDGHTDDEDNDVVPIPEAIRGLAFTKTDLGQVYGFGAGTTWWTLKNRWSAQNLKGAKIVQAWVDDPDAKTEDGQEEKYPHLNRISFNKLKSVIKLDQKGRYTRLGPKEESSDSDRGRTRRDRSRERDRYRQQSSGSRRSRSDRSGSPDLRSSDLDDEEPRRPEKSRKAGSSRTGRR